MVKPPRTTLGTRQPGLAAPGSARRSAETPSATAADLSGDSETLFNKVKNLIVNHIREAGGSTKGRAALLDMLLPFHNAGPDINKLGTRMNEMSEILVTERSAGRLNWWIVPRVAAFGFEAMFQTCMAFYLARQNLEEVKSPVEVDTKLEKLIDSVDRFIDQQVQIFLEMLGAKQPVFEQPA